MTTTKRADQLAPADLGHRVRVTELDTGGTCTGVLAEIATERPHVVHEGGSRGITLMFPSALVTVTLRTGWDSSWTGTLAAHDPVELDPT